MAVADPRSRPWVIRSGLPAAARTWDGGGTFLLAHLRRAMSVVYAWSPTPGLRASRLPLAYALLPPSGYKLFGRTRHTPWSVPPPENFVFRVKHSINCFAVFVGCVPPPENSVFGVKHSINCFAVFVGRVPPPENFVFGVKHSINCFAVFVGYVPASAVDCQRFATPGRRMRRPYICPVGQWYAPEARRSSGRRQARSAQPLCRASFTILLPRPGGAQECGGTLVRLKLGSPVGRRLLL